jgi:hypothetical protein
MTPEERELVADLFKRLAELERGPRDPDAERLIREGQARAPNAVYALVQTVLLQDEALKTANDHIAELEDSLAQAEEQAKQQSNTAGKWNTGAVLRGAGSVPSVGRADQPMGVPQGYDRDRGGYGDAYRDAAPGGGYGAPSGAGYGGPMGGEPSRGGGFLGTAAAIAAGAIGGGLLLNGIRSALGGQGQGKGPFSGAFDHLTGGKSDSPGTSGASAGSGDLARDAGLGDIGKSGTFGAADLGKDSKFDADDSDDLNDSAEEEDFSDDAFDDDDI